jgi:hypothetical protein
LHDHIAGNAIQVERASTGKIRKAILDSLSDSDARNPGDCGKDSIEAELGAVLTDEVQHEAAGLAGVMTEPTSELLEEQRRALRGAEEEQGIDKGHVDALVVEIAHEHHVDCALGEEPFNVVTCAVHAIAITETAAS